MEDIKKEDKTEVKKTKKKKYLTRKFVKELKRVRWPSSKKTWSSFWQTIIFTIIFTLVVIGFTTLIALIFKKMGIGINPMENPELGGM